MNDVTKTQEYSPLADMSSMVDELEKTTSTLDVKDGGAFIKFAKGHWGVGPDGEMGPDDTWIINPQSIVRGFIAFGGDNKPVERMAGLREPAISKDALGAPPAGSKNGWQAQIGFEMTCVNGSFEGQTFMYKGSSYGGRKMGQALTKEIVRRVRAAEQALAPIVQCGTEPYTHKDYGLTYNPVLKYIKWIDPRNLSEEIKALKGDTSAPAQPAADEAPAAYEQGSSAFERRSFKS